MPYKALLILTLTLFPLLRGWSITTNSDSVLIKAPACIIIGNKEIEVKTDTTVCIPDSLEFIILKNKKILFKSKGKLKDNRLTQYLKTWLFAGKPDTNNIEFNRQEYLSQFEGKIIRNIQVNNIDVFGATLTSSTPPEKRNWLERSGNRIHRNTRERIIINALHLKKGEVVDPLELSEKEVVIRNLPYIADVMITPIAVPNSDSIDLNIAVQDIWSFGLHWEPYAVNKGYVEVYEENAFGLGHEILFRTRYNATRSPATGYEAYYTINNIGSEIIKTTIGYSNYFDIKNFIFDMRKDYYYQSNTAFGVTFQDNITKYHFAYQNQDNRIGALNHDVWMGHGFPFKKNNFFDVKKPQVYAAVRFGTFKYDGERFTSKYYNHAFHNKSVYMGSLAIAKQWYSQTKLLLGYGRTEDVPYGYKVEVVGGTEVSEFHTRPYFAFKTAGGDFYPHGYLSGYFESGGYVNGGSIEQGVIKAGVFFYSNLMRIGLYRFRQFVNIDLTSGFNRFKGYGDELCFTSDNGIRGFVGDSIRATKRAYLRLETVAYSPHKIWDFKMAFFAYCDLAWLNTASNNILDGPIYNGFGLGVRIRNEKLAFKTFSIRLAIYPNVPRGGSYDIFDMAGVDRLRLGGFKPGQPNFVDYR